MLTLFIAAPSNDSSGRVRIVDEVSGATFEQEFTADLPAATQLLSSQSLLSSICFWQVLALPGSKFVQLTVQSQAF